MIVLLILAACLLSGIVGLVLCLRAACRHARFAILLSTLCRFASDLGAFAGNLFQRGAHACFRQVYPLLGLRSAHSEENDANAQLGDVLTVRLVYLFPSVCILLGELPLLSSKSAALYHLLQKSVLSQLPLDNFMAWLWIAVPVLLACPVIDALDLLPRSMHLFPTLHKCKFVRFFIAFVCLAFFVYALLLNYAFQQFGQCLLVNAACATDADLQINLASGFGVVTVAAAMLAFYGVFLGVRALVALLLMAVSFVLLICSHMCSLFSKSFSSGVSLIERLNPLSDFSFQRFEHLYQKENLSQQRSEEEQEILSVKPSNHQRRKE